ncbi:hypothetical protein [Pseudomonas juntendi]|uniref:hypothetical protein n=1 Tax=Pseudomonas TaxID=286 RepID=UPI001F28F26D|nr:hypothetical protein [Pseudomonas juntendi]MCO7058322.1 hypothetical protein [Pseudomonas juntendi]UJM15212.1 hypothetical protein L1P09_26125 [Pseudomonas juntendi]
MTIYGDEIDSALEAIEEAGGPVVLRFEQPGERDPVSQEETGGLVLTMNRRAVILPPGKSRDFEPGSLVGRDVVECWVAAKGAPHTPGKGWQLIAGGKTRTVFWQYELAPDGAPILWKLYAEA